MVKLASARECRMYGPRLGRDRAEYLNAGLYVLATILMLIGFVALLTNQPKPGLLLLLISLGITIVVNVHDLIAHLAAIDYWFPLMGFDRQLAIVEFAVPMFQILGTLLYFFAILFLYIETDKGYGDYKLEQHALNMLIAGSFLWLFGSILNSCQVYETADGYLQVMQEFVLIPFLMGSFLFLVGAVLNSREQIGYVHHGLALLGWTWLWFGIFGSIMLFIGGITNAVKVYHMQQIQIVELRLEKLRGGAQERLMQEREGRVPLILEDQSMRITQVKEVQGGAGPTPYRDVLIGLA